MRILILGGAGNIAYETAKLLSENNHLVYLGVHKEKEVQTVQEKNKLENIKMHVFKIDILKDKDLEILDKLEYDVIWQHAGIGIGGTLLYMDLDSLIKNYNTNVFATIKVIKKAYTNMKNKNIKGKIFITSSLAGYLPFPFLGCYTSSKASLSMLVRTIKQELKVLKSNITIHLIELGAYHTGFNQFMIDNKEKYIEETSPIYNQINSINRLQRNTFRLIENDNIENLSKKIMKNLTKKNPPFLIRYPKIQAIFTKIYTMLKI